MADAQSVVSFASRERTSAGSRCGRINRDAQCGSTFPENGLLSNTCSGTAQSGLQFSPDLQRS